MTIFSGDPAVWHNGERALQALTGKREAMEQRGRVVMRDHMADQHRLFFSERNQLFLATLDASGQPWATLLEGSAGFATSPSPMLLNVAAILPASDPASEAFVDGAPVGALGLEFETRRRNRVNGKIRFVPGTKRFSIEVAQSFGNCPQYIQARRLVSLDAMSHASSPGPVQRTTKIADADAALISRSDTFFIASRSLSLGIARSEGLDISHRGGRPGFVRIESQRHLIFPDYRGNFFFNTLGNLLAEPRCGILFIDFLTGLTLQIAGRGTVVHDSEALKSWPGAERVVAIEIEAVVRSERRSRFHFEFLGFSPQLDRFETIADRKDHST